MAKKKTNEEKFAALMARIEAGDSRARPAKWADLTKEQKKIYTEAKRKLDPTFINPDERKSGWQPGEVPRETTPENRRRNVPICGANRTGRSSSGEGVCCMPAGAGTDHRGRGACWKHGGRLDTHIIKDVKEQAMKAMVIYGAPRHVDADTAIMEELARTAGHVDWLRDMIIDLEGPEALQQVSAFGVGPNFWLKLYREERTHLALVAKTAKAMGISERAIRIQEEQGQMLAMAFMRFMEHPLMKLTAEQKAMSRTAAREVLLSLDVESREVPAHVRELAEEA